MNLYSVLFYIACLVLLALIMTVILLSGKLKSLRAESLKKDQALKKLSADLAETKESVDQIIKDKITELKKEEGDPEKSDFTLKRALKRSEEANFMKNAFLSNFSHEIRTPLNNIIGFASLLEAEISLLENKELFDYARAISESGDKLSHLLDNILDISKLEANDMQIKLKSCQLNNVVADTTQMFIFKANEQKLKLNLKINEVPAAFIDEKGLNKVLSIVLENAVKYTPNGFINVSTDFQTDKGEICIRIKDTGIGIDPTYLPGIFDPFRQDSLGYTKENSGAGLGLPLAKSLVEMMRGHIEIESAKGMGTTVTIFFPPEKTTDEIQPRKEPTKKEKFKTLQGLEIFIVEDDLMNKIVLFEMTKSLGNVITTMDGDEALKVIEEEYKAGKVFDIMLFDINLPPPWDGIKLMHEVRKKIKAYKTVPFVAQTAYAMTGDKEKLLEAGFDDYISKPINQQELYSIMKNQLNKL
ncbi:MAG: ATP-binding protein [Bacteroidales bacterium]|nr:ATP-binding protein [Bacteroidales bacterium]HPS50675.1 ATP-binding protein [Bacteroidales bacterium]